MSSNINSNSNLPATTSQSRQQPQPQTAPKMQAVIELICKNHGVDIYRNFAGIKLENPPYMPLVIEHVSGGRISVAHYYYQEGDACADPDIVFYFERDEKGVVTKWTPFEITQAALSQYFECYRWIARGVPPELFVVNRQADISEFAEMWATNLIDQGFTASNNERPQLAVVWKNEGED